MKTFNIYFKTIDDLESFLNQNKQIENSKVLLIQIFSGVIDRDVLIDLSSFLCKRLPHSKIIGATTSGEILEDKVSDEKIVLSFSVFEKSNLQISFVEKNSKNNSYDIGKTLAQNLLQNNTKVFILFGSGIVVDGEDFLNGVHNVTNDVTVAGGLSADNGKFLNTFLICQDKVLDEGAVGISINSDELYVNSDYSLAWSDIGKSFTVEKSIKNIVYKIDGLTPVELYKKYLGEDVAKMLPGIGIEFPLIIQENRGMKIARAVLGTNKDGSLTFAGDIKEGTKVKFGIGNFELLVNGSNSLAKQFASVNAQSIFLYSCSARKGFLNTQSYLDIQNFSKITNVAGFFTYGEFYTSKSKYELMNQTLTILSLSEEKLICKYINSEDLVNESDLYIRQKALSHLVNKTSEELDSLNLELENKVREKTKEIIKSNRDLEEHKAKLQLLNESLEARIEKEVENNKKIQERLFNSEKMVSMGEMIANIAHQWRQPLSLISTGATGMKMKNSMDMLNSEEITRTCTMINDNAQYLSQTIDDFKNFIKGKREEQLFNLKNNVDSFLHLVDSSIKKYCLKVIVDVNENLTLTGYPNELTQCFINIFNNSKDALSLVDEEQRFIFITARKKDEKIIITFKDSAGGIPKYALKKIFEPYFTTKHKAQGTGLGLHMVYNLINDGMKGSIEVQNVCYYYNGKEYKGAEFIICLDY